MALKLDLSGIKSYFFEKGEKVGMFACAAAAVALVGYGLMGGVGASTGGYSASLKSDTERIRQMIKMGQPLAATDKDKYDAKPDWLPMPTDFHQGSLFPTQDTANYKRLNPRALGILADPAKKQIQLTYINGTYKAYEINHDPKSKFATVIKDKGAMPLPKGQKFPIPQPRGPGGAAAGAGAQPTPITALQFVRMVVVDAVFPLSEQLEAFRKALRMSHQAELFQNGDLPRFLGLIVLKTEMTPGKDPVQSMLISYDPKTNKVELDPVLQRTLREAHPDLQLSGAQFAFQGLVMMQPELSSPPDNMREYPKADLEGIDWDNLVGGAGQAGVQPMPRTVGPRQPIGQPGGVRPNAGFQAMPGAANLAGGVGVEIELDPKMPWKKLSPDLDDKFNDKFYPLSPDGIFPDPDEGKPQTSATIASTLPPQNRNVFGPNNTGVSIYQGQSPHAATSQWAQFPAPEMPANLIGLNNPNPGAQFQPRIAPRGGVQGGAAVATKPYEALVRFIDVGVKPGSTYKYHVQVRIANPNFGKKTEVAFATLAEIAELTPAPPVETPAITIPEEYFLYAYDCQKPDNPKIVNGSDDKEAKADQVAVQIHRWAEKAADLSGSDFVIGDWVIAERILLRRGDPIARITNIEIPVWNKKLGAYELDPSMTGAAPPLAKKNGFEKVPAKEYGKAPAKKAIGAELGEIGGVPVGFAETTPPAVLVDFDGGKRRWGMNLSDESASNLLILNADGKLIVRSSRADSEPDTAEYKVRQQRITDWKAKVEPIRNNANPLGNPNPAPNNFLGGPRKG